MNSTQTTHNNGNHFVADNKKSSNNGSGLFNTLKRNLRAAAAAKICPNDVEAIKRIIS